MIKSEHVSSNVKVTLEDLGKGPRPYAPAKLAHFVIKTPRLDEMVWWYTTVLDGIVAYQDKMVTFITYDEEHHRVALLRLPRLFRIPGVVWSKHRKFWGIDHIAFSYDSLDRLVASYRRLANIGILPVWAINHGPTTSMYYEDPDGNRLELQVDNFDSQGELLAWLNGGDFDDNPIGVNFDPDVLEAKLARGVSHAELAKRGSATPDGQKPKAGYRTLRWKTL